MPQASKIEIEARADGAARTFVVREGTTTRTYHLPGAGQSDYLDFFAAATRDLGTRAPRNREPHAVPPASPAHRPLLTEALTPDILYGYGDPAVLWVPDERAWYMVVTSNDAPDAFPICRSRDLVAWEQVGFVFPRGRTPAWAQVGADVSDFWAPELHRVGDDYLVCFSAREPDRSLSIGVASSPSPQGPFACVPTPLLRGGVIDAHVFVEADGGVLLLWKEDSNGIWPRLLAAMFVDDPGLADALLDAPADRRTAALTAAMWPWAAERPAMEQFFILQPLIEAVVEHYATVRTRLQELGTPDAARLLTAMHTRIKAQRLDPQRLTLIGEPTVILVNDQDWEGHLVEGPWLTEQDGRFYLFYAGNDFSTDEYGIGVAVADDPLGPYRKPSAPLLRSDAAWSGPGHPSVASGPDGPPQLFYHAFVPGEAGYKKFRALLTAKLSFGTDDVKLI